MTPEDMPLDMIRAARVIRLALGQRRVLRRLYVGVAHVLLFAGMIVLFAGTLLVAVDYDLGWKVLRGGFYLGYEAVLDAFGLELSLPHGGGFSAKGILSLEPVIQAVRTDEVATLGGRLLGHDHVLTGDAAHLPRQQTG